MFNKVFVKVKQNMYGKAYFESKWGMRMYKSDIELVPLASIGILDKDFYQKIVDFLKPIEGQYELQLMQDEFSEKMKTTTKVDDKDILPKSYVELHNKVSNQWKERLKINNSMVFQYNLKVSLFKDSYTRQLVVQSDYYSAPLTPYTYDGEDINYFEKSNIFSYLYSYYGAIIYCKVKNFINRKEIKVDKEKQLKIFQSKMELWRNK